MRSGKAKTRWLHILRMLIVSMPKISLALGIPISHLELFQLFIFFSGMPGVRRPPNTIPERGSCARALRVGIGEHAGHSLLSSNRLSIDDLRIGYAQAASAIGHSDRCQTKRNLLTSRAIATSAPVPRGVFTALSRKFCGTLTLSDCEVYAVDVTRNFFCTPNMVVFCY